MRKYTYPSQDRLIELFDYEPSTGEFRWKNDMKGGVYAGAAAGTKPKTNKHVYVLVDGMRCLAHRLAWIFVHGSLEQSIDIDHRDLNKKNNAISNLRLATESQNMANVAIRSDNTSGVKGVHWDKKKNLWRANCTFNHKTYYVGRFKQIEDASTAVQKFREQLHGKFANHG